MPQKPQIVDITKSFLPGDPNAFVQNLVNTDREDGEEKTFPLLPYEGYNFLPTAYGYKSFFGTNSELGIEALASRAQFVLLYQIPTFKSRLIALCEDGIWVATADGQLTVWTQVVTHTFDPDVFEEWTWCIIENVLYMYKQGTAQVYRTAIGTWAVTSGNVGNPSDYQTFAIAENATLGYFVSGQTYGIYVAYKENGGNRYSPSVEFLGNFSPVAASCSLQINITGSKPEAGIDYVIYIVDATAGFTFVEIVSTGPILITSLTGTIREDILVYSGFALSDTGTGTGDFDAAAWEVYVQYTGVSVTYRDKQLLGTSTPGTNVDITVDNPYTIPESGNFRMILRQVASSTYYYKDFTAAVSYVATSLTGFTAATLGTLPDVYPLDPISLTNDLTITSFVPSFLNMSGQMGIFRAGLRLGMWDSANSVSWSSNLDLTDFTPSIENLAGNTIFGSVVGRIIHCRGHGEGFVVYSTKSIVGATFSATGNLLWDGKKILDNTGISFSRAVCCGKTDSEHYVFATTGIYTIGKYNALAGKYDAEPVLVEVYDLLKESRDPVYMTVLQDRYLCFSLIDDTYISGKLSFYTGYVNPYEIIVDWYVPDDGPSTGTETLLPEQFYEIIRNELGGKRGKSRDGKWIPLYTVSFDRMDTGYYAFWYEYFPGTITGLLSYFVRDPFIDTVTDSLTGGEITTNFDPPDASGHRGTVVTYTGVRAFYGQYDSNITDRAYKNVQTAIFNQRQEWDYFQRHQLTNVTYLRLIRHQNISYSAPYSIGSAPTLNPTSTVDTVLGTFITGEGNNEWITNRGPAVDAALEVILRRTFTKAWRVTKRQVTVETREGVGDGITYADTALYTTEVLDPLVPSWPASFYNYITYKKVSDNSIVGDGYDYNYRNGSGDSQYSTEYSFSITPASIFGHAPPSDGTYYRGIGTSISDGGSGYTHSIEWSNLFYDNARTKTTVTTTYIIEEITGTYGYSEMRATVTRWDRIKDNLYGNFEILESVTASAMTPDVWSGNYPTDRGTGRNFIDAYAGYKAVTAVDLAAGKVGSYSPYGVDANGTTTTVPTGFSTEGITSLHTSFTLPGTSFLLQTGSIEAVYPTFTGSLVYDLHLKKWGKYKGDHKLLIETTPLNTASYGSISYTDLGANAGIFATDGLIRLFDSVPNDSWIRYGKIGYYRLGMSNLLEVRASMRNPSDFVVVTESSMDGKVLDMSKNTYTYHYDEVVAEDYLDISARWHTVKIAGNFDLTGLEVRATLAGRR